MYEFLFFDLDDTLLDFPACERGALREALASYGVEMTPALQARYSEINDSKWKLFERGQIDRRTVQLSRFSDFFVEFGLPLSPTEFNARYLDALSRQAFLINGAVELLTALAPRYRLFSASNGVARVQESRLRLAGLDGFFEQRFNSETIGVQKPERGFFQACFAAIDGFAPERALLIGDSLTSDIQGGVNAGIDTCWFNPAGRPLTGPATPRYEIRSLAELTTILPV